MAYKIVWSQESLKNLKNILAYLNGEWTERETYKFKSKLRKQIQIISNHPKLFPISQFQPRLRKAVLSKQTSIFYEIKGELVFIVYLFSNKMNPRRIK